MSFRSLEIKVEYRSKLDNIAEDFYFPLLREGYRYDRAVGFFSSTALLAISQGLLPFVNHGGTIRMICSPKLSEEDIESIKKGYRRRKEVIEEAAVRELYEPKDFSESERLSLLSNLIADGRLEMKLALLEDYGMYHEKMGVIYDAEENYVAFSGSMNESRTAIGINYESIDTFCSWKGNDDGKRAYNKVLAFERLWKNEDEDIRVEEFRKVTDTILQKYKRKIQSYADFDEKDFQGGRKPEKNEVAIPEEIRLFDYQLDAIKSWKEHDFCGIFDMATGTGKTFTGIAAICELYKVKGKAAVVIVCPFIHLVEQWVEELDKFGIKPVIAYGDSKYKDYPLVLRKKIVQYNLSGGFLCLLTTVDTFSSEKIQKQLVKVKKNLTLVVDEAHNIGAASYVQHLDDKYSFRLALSATFERFGDKEGTERLYQFFGDKCICYSLEQAIKEGKLTEYKYYPVIVYLSETEAEKYHQLSREIAKNMRIDKDGKRSMNEKAKKLAIKRARIIAGAEEKKTVLLEKLEKYKKDKHILIYCGATKSMEEDQKKDVRQVDQITKMVHESLNMKTARFTAGENMMKRRLLLEDFSEGENLQALVAIKCLDEGVNIPAIRTAFILASTTNPKEYIQRRGRVLRRYPGKEYAEIYDFITLPYHYEQIPFLSEEELKYGQSLIKKELKRGYEFQRLARNQYEGLKVMMEIEKEYQISYEEEEENEQ